MRFERREGRTNRNKRAAGVASTYLYVDRSRRIARVLRGINVFGKKKKKTKAVAARLPVKSIFGYVLHLSRLVACIFGLDELSPTTLIVPRSRSYNSFNSWRLSNRQLSCSENKEKFFLQMIWIRILSSYCKCSS